MFREKLIVLKSKIDKLLVDLDMDPASLSNPELGAKFKAWLERAFKYYESQGIYFAGYDAKTFISNTMKYIRSGGHNIFDTVVMIRNESYDQGAPLMSDIEIEDAMRFIEKEFVKDSRQMVRLANQLKFYRSRLEDLKIICFYLGAFFLMLSVYFFVFDNPEKKMINMWNKIGSFLRKIKDEILSMPRSFEDAWNKLKNIVMNLLNTIFTGAVEIYKETYGKLLIISVIHFSALVVLMYKFEEN